MNHTFADILNTADKVIATIIDHATPDGHFVARVYLHGTPTAYLLRGDKGEHNAPIVGRIELHDVDAHKAYKGGALKGDGHVISHVTHAQSFAAMV